MQLTRSAAGARGGPACWREPQLSADARCRAAASPRANQGESGLRRVATRSEESPARLSLTWRSAIPPPRGLSKGCSNIRRKCFSRSTEGVELAAPDRQPVDLAGPGDLPVIELWGIQDLEGRGNLAAITQQQGHRGGQAAASAAAKDIEYSRRHLGES